MFKPTQEFVENQHKILRDINSRVNRNGSGLPMDNAILPENLLPRSYNAAERIASARFAVEPQDFRAPMYQAYKNPPLPEMPTRAQFSLPMDEFGNYSIVSTPHAPNSRPLFPNSEPYMRGTHNSTTPLNTYPRNLSMHTMESESSTARTSIPLRPVQYAHLGYASATSPNFTPGFESKPRTTYVSTAQPNPIPRSEPSTSLWPNSNRVFETNASTWRTSGPSKIVCANGHSQYTVGAASSCIPSCIEACLQMLYGRPLHQKTLEDILKAGSRYLSRNHVEARELYSSMKRYNEALTIVAELHYPLRALGQFVDDLARMANDEKQPIAAIITKPPESILIFVSYRLSVPIILFDSHPRPNLHPDSAAFLGFDDVSKLTAYMQHLMPSPQELGLQNLDTYTATIMSSLSVLVFKATKNSMDTTLGDTELLVLRTQYDSFELQQENMRSNDRYAKMARGREREVDRVKAEVEWSHEREMWNSNDQDADHSLQAFRQSQPALDERMPNQFSPWQTRLSATMESFREPSQQKRNSDRKVALQLQDMRLALQLQEDELAAFEREEDLKNDINLALRLQEIEMATSKQGKNTDLSSHMYGKSRQNILQCPICMEDYPMDNIFSIDGCDHRICRECATSYVQSALQERVFPCLCPCCKADAKPPCEIPQQKILSVLSPENQAAWLELVLSQAIASSAEIKFVYCRGPDCGKPTMAGTVEEADTLERVTCPYCSHEWCEKCDTQTWHQGVTCKDYQEWKQANGRADELTDETVLKEGYKRCPGPNCGRIVEKTEGCNHMTCICTTHFCFRCGGFLAGYASQQEVNQASAHCRCS